MFYIMLLYMVVYCCVFLWTPQRCFVLICIATYLLQNYNNNNITFIVSAFYCPLSYSTSRWLRPVACPPTQQLRQNISITFIQRRPTVFDVGPTLLKCYTNVLCLLLGLLTATDPDEGNLTLCLLIRDYNRFESVQFYWPIKPKFLGMKWLCKHKDL